MPSRSWLPPDHLAWQVIGVTGQLDLSGFAAAYRADGQGQAAYDPAMVTGLLLYCYFKGIRSSRKIAAACVDDLGCRVICGGRGRAQPPGGGGVHPAAPGRGQAAVRAGAGPAGG